MTHIAIVPRHAAKPAAGRGSWLGGLLRAARDWVERARLARQLEDMDDHLLEDMGLVRTETGYQRLEHLR